MSQWITLYKSLSPVQLAAVISSSWRRFSPDSPEQRMFYPKINLHYAEQIARQWDAAQYAAGYVVSFKVSSVYMDRYQIQTVAYDEHREYKVPIGDLELLNNNIAGRIEVISAFTEDNLIWTHSELESCTGYH